MISLPKYKQSWRDDYNYLVIEIPFILYFFGADCITDKFSVSMCWYHVSTDQFFGNGRHHRSNVVSLVPVWAIKKRQNVKLSWLCLFSLIYFLFLFNQRASSILTSIRVLLDRPDEFSFPICHCSVTTSTVLNARLSMPTIILTSLVLIMVFWWQELYQLHTLC